VHHVHIVGGVAELGVGGEQGFQLAQQVGQAFGDQGIEGRRQVGAGLRAPWS